MEALQSHVNTILDPIVAVLESLSWIGTNTVFVNVPMIDDKVVPIAESLGMSLVLTKYTLSLFLVYPLAGILSAIPHKDLKHTASLVFGFVIMQWIYGADWIHSFITALATYLIAILAPSKYQHIINFVFIMSYMVGAHGYRMYVSYLSDVFDFTGTQMVLTMKLTSFAFNYYDGTTDHKNVFDFPSKPRHVDNESEEVWKKRCSNHDKKRRVYEERKKYAITSLPNPLEYFGYVFCFTCILAGPAFEYNDYVRSIDGSAFEYEGKSKNPTRFLPAMKRLLVAIISMVLYLQATARFPAANLYDPDFIESTPTVQRYVYSLIAMLGIRFKFYFVWKIAEGASILGGFGFEGYEKNGEPKGWGGVENIDILGFELAPNVQILSRVWNKRTQGWLERYTYKRTNNNLLLLYFVSAIWHGLYPGFFFFFMSIPLMTNIERLSKAKINPLIVPGYVPKDPKTYPKTFLAKAYWAICVILLIFFMNNIVQPFNFGSFERSHRSLMSFNYFGHVVLTIAYVILEVLPSPASAKEKKQ